MSAPDDWRETLSNAVSDIQSISAVLLNLAGVGEKETIEPCGIGYLAERLQDLCEKADDALDASRSEQAAEPVAG